MSKYKQKYILLVFLSFLVEEKAHQRMYKRYTNLQTMLKYVADVNAKRATTWYTDILLHVNEENGHMAK